MARLLFPAGKVILVPCGVVRTLGRADVARYPEAATVSRVQCTVENLKSDDEGPALRLTSKGSQNPTLVIKTGAGARDLQQGHSALLRTGDAFSLISTRPDLAIKVQIDPQTSPSSDKSEAVLGPAQAAASPTELTPPDKEKLDGGTQSHQLTEGPGGPEPCSSPSEAYTSDDGGHGARARLSEDGAEADEASGGAPHGAAGASSPSGGDVRGGKKVGRGSQARGVSNGKPPARSAPPVLLLLAGLPGSGKSTFSRELLKSSPIAWVHVNQDAIRGGKPGTREQCIAAARAALAEGACCVVDRCHADAAQRATLRAVASERGLPAHCVALQTPPELCAKRVAVRTDHPGGVQGDGSKRVVFTMASQMKKGGSSWPPAASEGFLSVMDCLNDADAAAAVRAWAVYGKDDGGDGTAGGPGPAATAATAATHGSAEAGQGAHAGSPDAATLAVWRAHVAKRKPGHGGIMSFFKPATTAAKGAAAKADVGASTPPAAKGAVPRTSTAQAVQVPSPGESARGRPAATTAAAAATAAGAARGGATTAGVKGLAPAQGRTTGTRRPLEGPPADAPGAKRQAVDVPSAGEVQGATASSGGQAGLPSEAGPTGNGESKESGGNQISAAGEGAGQSSSGQASRNAFAVMMASKSRNAAGGGGDTGSKRPSGPSTGDEVDARFKLTAPWAQELRKTALHPEAAQQQQVLHKDDQVVMILDAFPKAKHHALVIARDPLLRSIADLRREHLPLLAHMEQLARRWVQEAHRTDPGAAKFKLGFHAVPSMCQVHMHVVSQDFDSPALKNKKHWNSFTTQFFLPLDAVKSELEARGRLALMDQTTQTQLEGQELRCHGCNKHMKSMPELKKHIVVCDAVRLLPGLGG